MSDSTDRNTVVEFTWGEYLSSLQGVDKYHHHSQSDWTDDESWDSAKEKMHSGDDAYVSMASELLDKLQDITDGVPARQWTPSPMGAFPVVPEFLMGLPMCMRAMAPSGDLAPMRIIISSTCSGGIDKQTMTKRGAAILALLQKLQAIRPIELVILVEGNEGGRDRKNLFQLIKVDTKPLSIAHACFAIANVGFARQLTYGHMHHYHGWDGGWPADYNRSGYDQLVREACGFSPEDLWIKSSYLEDSLLASDPVKWVNEQLARYAPTAAE